MLVCYLQLLRRIYYHIYSYGLMLSADYQIADNITQQSTFDLKHVLSQLIFELWSAQSRYFCEHDTRVSIAATC